MFPTPRTRRPDPRRLAASGLLLITAACGGAHPEDDCLPPSVWAGDRCREQHPTRPADPRCAERPELCS